jgi:hypothetical protein
VLSRSVTTSWVRSLQSGRRRAEAQKVTRPHLRRSLVVVAASALFAVTASGSALAWNGTVRQVSLGARAQWAVTPAPDAVTRPALSTTAAAVERVAQPAAQPRRSAKATRTVTAPEPAPARATSSTARKASAARKSADGPRTVTISHYVDAPGSQAQIDRCHLVLWTHSPLWLAGHNWCGYQWLAFVPTGTTVVVTSGAAAGRYVVTRHITLHRQSGSLPSLSADLVLQTCVGSSTGLTLLHRV